jgi:hypothetical protein
MTKPALIDLVNAALVRIGQEPIVSLNNVEDVSPTVVAVRSQVYVVKRKLLRMNDWNCARITVRLARIAASAAANLGWDYAYALPEDPECLRIVQISIDGGKTFIDLDDYYNRNAGLKATLFDVDRNNLLCNADDVYIKYTGDIDAAQFDAALAAAFVALLAADLAYSLPASVSLADYLNKVAKQEIKSAKSINARERNILRPEGEVIGIRYQNSDKCLRVDMSDQEE